ncbi:hypothetical protein [uncultured Granulicatella sp.]|jgi:llaI.1|uniref:hypothetical protein n=1 Tax=uncultured Granulicatella sp. TaxID=316089 RepID=UPI0028D0B972|nr:hypothetical protein [uncultured Granulicatella sp.]
MRKLLLQESYYQKKFNKIDVVPPPGVSKLEYIETKLLQEINNKNQRLNVFAVEYVDINSEFIGFIGGNYSALIVDEEKIPVIPSSITDDSRYFVDANGNNIRQKIRAFVFTSPATKDEGRNITVAQDIFPRLLDYIEHYINSPSYTYANHPFYYISLMNSNIDLQASILANYARLNLLDFEYIELFPTNVNFSAMPKDVDGAIEFIANIPKSRKTKAELLATDDYTFDILNKKLTILSTSLQVDLINNVFGTNVNLTNSGIVDFNGSAEKFYWLDILSMFELALRNNYEIDYSQLWDWYNQNFVSNSFGQGRKFQRFQSLLKYFDKKTLKG